MEFKTNKQKGNSGLGIAIDFFTTKGIRYKTLIDTSIDILFIVTSNLSIYIIPKNKIKNRSTINLCNRYEKYKAL